MEWLKWYLSVPLRALAAAIFGIARARAHVRAWFAQFDLRKAVVLLTLATAAAWFVIWLTAEDADRSRLTDTVRELFTDGAE